VLTGNDGKGGKGGVGHGRQGWQDVTLMWCIDGMLAGSDSKGGEGLKVAWVRVVRQR